MHEEQPRVEILSRNRVNRSTIIVAVIPVTLFSGVLIYALWSFLWLLAYGALTLLSISFLYLVAIMTINVYQRLLHAPYIHVEEQNGMFDASGRRMYPLALPQPVVVTEAKVEDEPIARVKQALDVLDAHSHGVGIKSIAESYKQSGDKYWSEWRVRQVIDSQKKP